MVRRSVTKVGLDDPESVRSNIVMRLSLLLLVCLGVLSAPPVHAKAPCKTRTFQVPETNDAWSRKRTGAFTVKQGEPRHRAQDVVVKVGNRAHHIGKFAYGAIDKDLTREMVSVHVQTRGRCGPWAEVGRALTTDGDGAAVDGVADDGGRLYYKLPAPLTQAIGHHPAAMMVRGDRSFAPVRFLVVPDKTQAVVFDIDETLTVGDGEITHQLLAKLSDRNYVPKMRPGAPEVVKAWADKGYLVVYLSGRPDLLRPTTLNWLKIHGFPPGIIHLTDTLRQVLPGNDKVGAYKRDYLKRLAAHVTIHSAYGNAETDIFAYAEAGVAKTRTFIIGESAGQSGTVALSDYPSHLKAAQAVARPPAFVPLVRW